MLYCSDAFRNESHCELNRKKNKGSPLPVCLGLGRENYELMKEASYVQFIPRMRVNDNFTKGLSYVKMGLNVKQMQEKITKIC